MTERGVTESVVAQAALAWLESVGWSIQHGAETASGELAAECSDYSKVVLEQRLRDVSVWLKPGFLALY
jgi:type I restriction enzyme R subunit